MLTRRGAGFKMGADFKGLANLSLPSYGSKVLPLYPSSDWETQVGLEMVRAAHWFQNGKMYKKVTLFGNSADFVILFTAQAIDCMCDKNCVSPVSLVSTVSFRPNYNRK
jgi:hypothetical protein